MVGRDWQACANAFRYVRFSNSFEISIDIDGYQSSTNAFDPLKLLAVLIGVDPAWPIAAATSAIAKKSLSGKRPLYPIDVYVTLKLSSVLIG